METACGRVCVDEKNQVVTSCARSVPIVGVDKTTGHTQVHRTLALPNANSTKHQPIPPPGLCDVANVHVGARDGLVIDDIAILAKAHERRALQQIRVQRVSAKRVKRKDVP